jgi:transketolase
MPTVKPIDKELIIACAKSTGIIMTVEEHNLSGGFGSAVAEVLADSGVCNHIKFKRIGLPDIYVSKVGTHEWLRDFYGLGVENIIKEALELIG